LGAIDDAECSFINAVRLQILDGGPIGFAGHAEQIENIDAVEQVQAELVVERGWIGA
jgi:hypothetical protein